MYEFVEERERVKPDRVVVEHRFPVGQVAAVLACLRGGSNFSAEQVEYLLFRGVRGNIFRPDRSAQWAVCAIFLHFG